MALKQISVFLENKPGMLAEVARTLSASGVNLRAISCAEASAFGIFRIIVDDVYEATTALKDAGYIVNIADVLAVEVKDKPGALADFVEILGDNGINVEYMYAIIVGKTDSAYMVIRVDDNEKALKVIKAAGLRTVSQEELA